MYVLVVAATLVPGCTDDSTSPVPGIGLSDIAGGWEVINMRVGDLVHELPHNNSIWYFADNGDYCSLWITAYGSFYEGSTGKVSARRAVLTENTLTGEVIDWTLSLSVNTDTLRADLAVPGSSDIAGWILVREVDAPEPPCFN